MKLDWHTRNRETGDALRLNDFLPEPWPDESRSVPTEPEVDRAVLMDWRRSRHKGLQHEIESATGFQHMPAREHSASQVDQALLLNPPFLNLLVQWEDRNGSASYRPHHRPPGVHFLWAPPDAAIWQSSNRTKARSAFPCARPESSSSGNQRTARPVFRLRFLLAAPSPLSIPHSSRIFRRRPPRHILSGWRQPSTLLNSAVRPADGLFPYCLKRCSKGRTGPASLALLWLFPRNRNNMMEEGTRKGCAWLG